MRGLLMYLGMISRKMSVVTASFLGLTGWTASNSIPVNTGILDALGGLTAGTIAESVSTSTHAATNTISVSSGQQYTMDVVLAPGTIGTAFISVSDGLTHSAFVNISTGVIGTISGVISVTSTASGLLNSFRKFTIKWIATTTGPATISINLAAAAETLSYLGIITNTITVASVTISTP